MKQFIRSTAKLLAIAAALTVTSAAQAYFVRPVIDIPPGERIDGYELNGATNRTELFAGSHFAEVDLREGTVRNYLEMDHAGTFGQAAGVMGDRLTFMNAGGTDLSFSFAYDGTIDALGWTDPTLNSPVYIYVYANFWVYDASLGIDYLNFASAENMPRALAGQQVTLDFSNPTESFYESINDVLSGSFTVPNQSYYSVDVFASLAIYGGTYSNPITVTMDFTNTGRFGIDMEPEVTFTSESGAFLGSDQTPAGGGTVPEPSSMALIGLALAGLMVSRWRNTHRAV